MDEDLASFFKENDCYGSLVMVFVLSILICILVRLWKIIKSGVIIKKLSNVTRISPKA